MMLFLYTFPKQIQLQNSITVCNLKFIRWKTFYATIIRQQYTYGCVISFVLFSSFSVPYGRYAHRIVHGFNIDTNNATSLRFLPNETII